MSKGGGKFQRKKEYFAKLSNLLVEYKKVLIVSANNVGSNQLQRVRQELRGKAVLLMGKNTMIRKCVRENLTKNTALEALLPYVKGNVGFVFTNGDLSDIRTRLSSIKVKSAAKNGAIAPCDVIVPAGPTGQDPAKTSFFQALSIATRIAKGVIEIVNDVHLVKEGGKVTASQAALLQMLNIQPFEYALTVRTVYDDGSVYPVSLLDITDDDIIGRFRKGITNVAALSIRIGYPTVASMPYALTNSFRNLLAVSVATSFTFPQAAKLKELLSDPAAFAAAVAAAAPAGGAAPAAATTTSSSSGGAAAEKPAAKEVEEEQEEDMDAGGLFGGDDEY
jgi:large subunit ribosomal protein LP0